MRQCSVSRVVWLPVMLGLLAGCGGASDHRGSAGRQKQRKQPRVVNPEELPKLGDYLPPLDSGRIEVAVPEGWYVPPASGKYVVRFQKSMTSAYPSVIVTAEDCQGEGIENVSRDNVREFADHLAVSLNKEKSAVQPFEMDDFVGVAYRKRAKEPKSVSKIIDLFYLDTVVAGRKYSIHLRSREGSLEKDQPYLYAVVRGIRFTRAGSNEKPGKMQRKEGANEGTQEEPKNDEAAEEEPKTGPKDQAAEEGEEKAKQESNKDGNFELDLDKLDELLK